MKHDNAPATVLLASRCAVCARKLKDAKSVELGIGPDCRAEHGFDVSVPEAARVEANRIVHAIAVNVRNDLPLAHYALWFDRLRVLGFAKLADRIADRLPKAAPTITISLESGAYVVRAPYNAEHVQRMRRVPGRRWDNAHKVDRVPVYSKHELWAALRASFAGALAQGPQGAFVVA